MRDRLVRRRPQRAAQRPAGLEAHVHRPRATGEARARAIELLRARSASSLAGDPQRDRARLHVGRRGERHVDDVDARAAERERDLGDDARAGSAPRRAARAPSPPARSASSSAPAVLARGVVPGRRSPSPSPRRAAAPRTSPQAARRRRRCAATSASALDEVDVASRSRCWRRPRGWRRGSSGRSRGSRSRLRRAAPRGLRDEHVGEHVRQVRDAWPSARSCVVGVDRRRARAEAGEQRGAGARRGRPPVARGRRQVPGRRRRTGPRARARRPRSRRPASGWPPTKRWSSTAAATSARLVEPTSVTTQSGAAPPPAPRATDAGQRAHRRGDEHDVGAARPPRRPMPHARVDRAALERARRARRRRGRSRGPRRRGARARPARSSRRSARRRGPRRSARRRSDGDERLAGDRRRRARPARA